LKSHLPLPIYFLGLGGFAKEVLAAWEHFDLSKHYSYAGFFDDDAAKASEKGYQGSLAAVSSLPEGTALLIAFTATEAKQRLVASLSQAAFSFPNAIHQSAQIGQDVQLGHGNIISAGCILTTEIELGDFNILNHYVTIGHHCRLGTGNALMTKAHLSGHVTLGDYNLLAVGSSILQGKSMGKGNILGPHACLMNNVGDGQTYLGSPALAVK
jgi:sugar O-acyltransferase (sialic acid O-acetyltransferase NeuD family)